MIATAGGMRSQLMRDWCVALGGAALVSGAIVLLSPHLSVQVGAPIDPADAASARFTVSDVSLAPADHLKVFIEPCKIPVVHGGYTFSLVGDNCGRKVSSGIPVKALSTSKLSFGQTQSFALKDVLRGAGPVSSADLVVDVRYSAWGLPLQFGRRLRFQVTNTDGRNVWRLEPLS